MANKNFSRAWSLERALVIVPGRFATGAAGALGAVTGHGFTVVKSSGTGRYTVTLNSDMRTADTRLLSVQVSVTDAALVDADAHFESFDGSDGSFIIQVYTPSTGAALDPANFEAISFALFFSNSSAF